MATAVAMPAATVSVGRSILDQSMPETYRVVGSSPTGHTRRARFTLSPDPTSGGAWAPRAARSRRRPTPWRRDRLAPATWTTDHRPPERRPAGGALTHVDVRFDLGRRQPSLVETADLSDLLVGQLALAYRDRPAAKGSRHRCANHPGVLGDLPHGLPTDVDRHRLVDLCGVEKSLSHPDRAEHWLLRVPNPGFQRATVVAIDTTRQPSGQGFACGERSENSLLTSPGASLLRPATSPA